MRGLATVSEHQFEEAARYHDRIRALEKYSDKQKVVAEDQVDHDVFVFALAIAEACFCRGCRLP